MKPLLSSALLVYGLACAAMADDRALVIGIDDYTSLTDPRVLVHAAGDAQRFAAFLTDRAGFTDMQVTVLTDAAATSDGIMNAVIDQLIGQTAPGDRIVLYFAGLGTTTDGVPTLIAADGAGALGQLPLDLFDELFDLTSGRAITIVLDTGFAGQGRSIGTTAPADFATLGAGNDRIVWTAASPGEGAWESGDGGVFTSFLLEGMGGVADRNGDRIVTNAELAAHLQIRSASWCATLCVPGTLTPTFAGPGDQPAFIPEDLLPQGGVADLPDAAPLSYEELLAFITDLFGPSNSADLRLQIDMQQPMAIGTPVTFSLTSGQAGAMVLLDIGTDGRLIQVFPSALAPDEGGFIAPGRLVTIPSGASANGLPLQVRVSGPPGRGILLALFTQGGTTADLAAVLPAGLSLDGLPDAGPLLYAVAQNLLQRDADPGQTLNWSATFIPYEVAP